MKYTESHEWVKIEKENVAFIGVSDHAQSELGDIVYVELPQLGETIRAGQEVAVLESTKAAADVYSPVSGKIIAVNDALEDSSETINSSAEGEGWLFKLELSDTKELDSLMDENAYQQFVS